MAGNQTLRGNPELKQVYLNMGFQGGMNVAFADDLLPPNISRNLVNFELENIGELSSRKGFGKNNALTNLLYPNGVYHNNIDLSVYKETFFTLLQNDNMVWQRLADSKSLEDYLELYGEGALLRYLRLLVNKTTHTLYWEDITVTITSAPTILVLDGTINNAIFASEDILFNWQYVDKYGRLYFTNNDKGLLIFDAESETPEEPWTYVGAFTGKDNEAYKPNGIEARKLGFNVLGTNPLTWLYESELTTESIQGIYLTTEDRKPVQIVPAGIPFQVNILYTGDTYAFSLTFKEYDTTIEATITKNTTLSTDGSLAVYDVTLKTQPSDEVEIGINFDSEAVTLDTYYDYYPVGSVPGDAEVVEQLNVGEFKMLEMYDRLVYYKGNAIWFSEVDVYDYIPNFNYVLVPLDKTDEIVKIIFFRTSYIVFTKRRIYKLTGDFEQSTFNLDLVNDNLGCIAGETAAVIDNQLYFVSTQGLRALKTDTFRENLENIKEFDEPISPLIPNKENMYGVYYKDQYVLFNNFKNNKYYAEANLREYRIPDAIRYYYKQNSYISDIYAKDSYPEFMFFENGKLYSFKTNGVYRLGDAYSDFGKQYDAVLETTAINFGYPTHEKKIKYVLLKASGGSYDQPILLQIAVDGEIVVSSELMPVGTSADGSIIYEDQDPIIASSEPIETQFGEGITKYHTKKFRATARGKNIAMRIISSTADRFIIQGYGYIYKLGKVRE